MRVYLSGGMRSGWQGRVMDAVPGLSYINPCDHGLDDSGEYTAWDLLGVRLCDVVFAYLEADNPSGIGLSLEMGYAKALGKTVILVEEQHDRANLDILRAAADVWCDNLERGLTVLRSMRALADAD